MNYKVNKDKFRKAMLEKGYTLTKLQSISTVSTVTLNNLVNNEGYRLRAVTANKIAKALDVPVTELFE